ncbi:LysR substrate-binding domain-containing protein [Agrobacterium radiobacter]|jgi:LysR family transcriptional activator of mexEF-oprN operon|uniref:DNA-binding transcriptional LysR family regulator n=3 Tax=Agrobacterium tumefaciens complex TaxID=1183400 RepID=A0AAP9J639_AGRTU|nr:MULTISPECIES: LysR substrate-binding domain-containing protein [Agrobacterium]MCP2134026.1 DNA-binding transcriptional LysR family regulator [Rhizobium sp. SLBN-94]TGE80643.1 LysR family transcriptional regulator [Rhizobium sp. SEMIA 439]AYM06127.1 LysR family transcriptional regulator [Agrobacterium tumefaciens]EPR23022.1 LysR family transcriptional regulator [Agrobacterium radiobacter DSM 30147]KAA1237538.1 LysR family transcriptional regulator [Agrobacterium tumefaciens]
MQTIDHFNLRSFDLNLLIAFDAMMEEMNVTRAARRLKIQQPAMSHNLSTLRTLFQDELFIRVGQEMKPTARALNLAGPVRQALRQAQAAVLTADVFDPATERRTFRLGMSSEVELLLLPDLTARLREIAPGIRILARNGQEQEITAMLDTGVIDMAVGCTYSKEQRHHCEPLYSSSVFCCFNPALLDLPNPVGLDAYVAAKHAVISQTDSLHGCIKDALELSGLEIDVVAAAPDFLSVLATARSSAVLATVSSRIALRYAPLLGLEISPVPVALNFPPVAMVWALQTDADAGAVWLRQQIREAMGRTVDGEVSGIAA